MSIDANIKKTHIFYEMKYDLKGPCRSQKAFNLYVYLFSSYNSSVKPTLPFHASNCVSASPPDSH